MLYEANIYQMEVEEHVFWIAESKTLKGCVGQGETSEEAIKELEKNELVWLKVAKECGIAIPVCSPKRMKQYSGKLSLRMSPYVHEKAAEASEHLGISLNQYVNDAIISYTKEVMNNLYPPSKINGELLVFKPKQEM